MADESAQLLEEIERQLAQTAKNMPEDSDENKAYVKGYNNAIVEAVKKGFTLAKVNEREVAELVQQSGELTVSLNTETVEAFKDGHRDGWSDVEEECKKAKAEGVKPCGLFECGIDLPEEREFEGGEEFYSEEARLNAVEAMERRIDDLKIELDEAHIELERLAALGVESDKEVAEGQDAE